MCNTSSRVMDTSVQNTSSTFELQDMLNELIAMVSQPAILANRKRVAIIGSGPAGLGASAALVKAGHEVHVFEAAPSAGFTLLRTPAQESSSPAPDALAPLDEKTLEAAIYALASSGINFHICSPQGQSDMEKLLNSFNAVICACGKAAVLPTEENGLVKGRSEGRFYATGTCVKNQKVQDAIQAMRSGIKVGESAARNLA